MSFDLILEREFSHPVERLWWALTDRDALEAWFMKTDIQFRLGVRFTIRGAPDGAWRGWTECEILECEPMRRIVWSFACEDGHAATIVTFTIQPTKNGSRLTLRHQGDASPIIADQIECSWPLFLRRLGEMLATSPQSAVLALERNPDANQPNEGRGARGASTDDQAWQELRHQGSEL